MAINDNGQIVGYSDTQLQGQPGPVHPFLWKVLWDNGQIIDLGTLPNGNVSVATGINMNVQISAPPIAPDRPASTTTRRYCGP